ncbi:MAG TPA: protoheme IX farnesyltransferase, partial [Candidatus Acidoferrum sp.]|nr:protoheme IX farnesyltransferase [Candidatus Acidoferrum sp.]
TPLKRVTWLNTAIGAIPGALPPLMGWTAARNELSGQGWALFAILAFWQLPHFFAIAWIYREQYAKAGFVMLPNVDADGRQTGQQTVSNALALLIVSLCPFLFKMAGMVYLAGAALLGIGFLFCAIQFSRQLTLSRARRLFLASILYLPLLLALMVFDKVR